MRSRLTALPALTSPLAFRSYSLAVIIVYYKGTYIVIDKPHKNKGTYLVKIVSGLISLGVVYSFWKDVIQWQ